MAGVGVVSIPGLITAAKIYRVGFSLLRRDYRVAVLRARDAAAWALWLNGIIFVGSLLFVPRALDHRGIGGVIGFVDAYGALSILQALLMLRAARVWEDAFFTDSGSSRSGAAIALVAPSRARRHRRRRSGARGAHARRRVAGGAEQGRLRGVREALRAEVHRRAPLGAAHRAARSRGLDARSPRMFAKADEGERERREGRGHAGLGARDLRAGVGVGQLPRSRAEAARHRARSGRGAHRARGDARVARRRRRRRRRGEDAFAFVLGALRDPRRRARRGVGHRRAAHRGRRRSGDHVEARRRGCRPSSPRSSARS